MQMGTKTSKPNQRRLRGDLKRLSDELAGSTIDRYIFERWWSIISNNPKIRLDNRFIALICSSYFDRQTMVVRRQVKKDSISLVRLLENVAEHNEYFTRHNFLKSYINNPYLDKKQVQKNVSEAAQFFNSFADRGKPFVSRSKVQNDIIRLKRKAHMIEYYADKWVAHSDHRRRWPRFGFNKIHSTLDLIFKTWKRYHHIIMGGPVVVDAAFVVGSKWEEVLTFPWKQ